MSDGPAFAITGVTRDPGTGQVTLTWPSSTGQTFDVFSSATLAAGQWSLLSPAAGVPAAEGSTSFTDTTVAPNPNSKTQYYRVSRR
jgi:hypothetical protein